MGRKKLKLSHEEVKKLREPDGNMFHIDKILSKWTDSKTGDVQYHVSWLGYPKSYDTWEPVSCFAACMDVLEEFEKKRELKLERSQSRQDHKKSKFGDISISLNCLEQESADPIEVDSRFLQRQKNPGSRIILKKEFCISKNDYSEEVNQFDHEPQLVAHTKNDKFLRGPFFGLGVSTERKDEGCCNNGIENLNANAIVNNSGASGEANIQTVNVAVIKVENDSATLSGGGPSAYEETEGGKTIESEICLNNHLETATPLIQSQDNNEICAEESNSTVSEDWPIPELDAESYSPSEVNPASFSSMPSLGQPMHPLNQNHIRILTPPDVEKRALQNQNPLLIGALNFNEKIHLIARWDTMEQAWSCFSVDLGRVWYPSLTVDFFTSIPYYNISQYAPSGILQERQCRFWGPRFDCSDNDETDNCAKFDIEKIFEVSLSSKRHSFLLHEQYFNDV